MSDHPDGDESKSRWLSPYTLFALVGMIGAIVSAWMSLDSRTTTLEVEFSNDSQRLTRIEEKIDALNDRIIESRFGKRDHDQ